VEHAVQLRTQRFVEVIRRQLDELTRLEELPLVITESRQGNRWLFDCQFELPAGCRREDGVVLRIQQYYLAGAIAQAIATLYEEEYARRRLRLKYRMKRDDCDLVVPKIREYLDKELKGDTYRTNRRTRLMAQILNCLEAHPVFDLEGFLTFRAQDYRAELDRALELAVEQYLVQREYVEFVRLLKHFVDAQTPRLDVLHVGISSQGRFQLYNDAGKKVTQQFLDEMSSHDESSDISCEDLLISALIAVAPRQIVFHVRYDGYQETLQTIRSVFEERVSYCTGCAICAKL